MAKIAYILLCHKDPLSIIQHAERLTAVGDCMAIHFDARSDPKSYKMLRDALDDNPNVVFAKKREKCGWGEWSLVRATLNAVEAAEEAFADATHFYMISGDCQAIKSAEYTHAFLDGRDVDYIESFDYFESDWIKTGMKEERLIYRHFFNERTQKRRFYASFNLQRKMGWTREIPSDIQVMIGSQWWCLRRRTIEWVLEFTRTRKDVMRFFSTTWIPDETFFQTIVRHVVPEEEIVTRTLTFLMFTDYGMPVTFYNDHYDLLLAQDFLFARKISPEAEELKTRLGTLYAEEGRDFEITDEGRNLFTFLTNRGREGRRFGQRFWEANSQLGRGKHLHVLMCKKWHVAKRLAQTIRDETDLPVLEFLFSEKDAGLPDMGGIENSLAKRTRHRRAFIKLLFDYYDSDDLLICLDSSNFELLKDFYADNSGTRLLELRCDFSDDYLQGHARRVGLAGDNTPQIQMDRLLPTIRADVHHEHSRVQDENFPQHFQVAEAATDEANAAQIARFLGVDYAKALKIAQTQHLFAD